MYFLKWWPQWCTCKGKIANFLRAAKRALDAVSRYLSLFFLAQYLQYLLNQRVELNLNCWRTRYSLIWHYLAQWMSNKGSEENTVIVAYCYGKLFRIYTIGDAIRSWIQCITHIILISDNTYSKRSMRLQFGTLMSKRLGMFLFKEQH